MEPTIGRLSSKGQVVIPQNVRRHLGLQAGDTVVFVLESDRVSIYPQFAYLHLLRGMAKGIYGNSAEAIDNFVKDERDSWPES